MITFSVRSALPFGRTGQVIQIAASDMRVEEIICPVLDHAGKASIIGGHPNFVSPVKESPSQSKADNLSEKQLFLSAVYS